MQSITPLEFEQLSTLLYQQTGVYLQPTQTYLIETRLSRLILQLGLNSVSQLLNRLHSDPKLLPRLISLMTTHETLWFRDFSCWNALEKAILPTFLQQIAHRKQLIKIWCAGCSTGQEAYSLAILIDELCRKQQRIDWVHYFSIRAMDICENVLETAKQAQYNRFEMERGLSMQRRLQYFQNHAHGHWQLIPEIRHRVFFESINLIHDFSHLGEFDLILCRNVTIYFKPEVRQYILMKMATMLKSKGALFIGATESLAKSIGEVNLMEFENCVYIQSKN
ncbi:MAG: hypothetical protein RL637_187 [Pseudomonadota bacterium]|jgi:chemotaxis protein methyltransferase CheR